MPPGAFAAITRFIFLWSCRGGIYAARAFPITAHSPGNRRAASVPPLPKRQRTVSTACCLIYLLYTLSQVFVDSRILTW